MATVLDMRPPGSEDPQSSIGTHILATVGRKKVCSIEDLLQGCEVYSWNQVFLEVDRMSRTGEITLLYQKEGDYAVSLPAA